MVNMVKVTGCKAIVALSLLYWESPTNEIPSALFGNVLDNYLPDRGLWLLVVQQAWLSIQRDYPQWIRQVRRFWYDDQCLRWAIKFIKDGRLPYFHIPKDEPTVEGLSNTLEKIIDAGWDHAIRSGVARPPVKKPSFVRTRETEAQANDDYQRYGGTFRYDDGGYAVRD